MEFVSLEGGVTLSVEYEDGAACVAVRSDEADWLGVRLSERFGAMAASLILGPPPDEEKGYVDGLVDTYNQTELLEMARNYAAAYALSLQPPPETLPDDVQERWRGASREDAIRVAESLRAQLESSSQEK